MKKLWKTIILSFCISCICCLCFGMTAMAKTYSGKMRDGFSWTMDTDTGTLTINGNGYFYDKNRFYETHLCWAPYQNQIRHIVLGKNVTWPGLVTELDKGELLSFPNLPNLESFSGSMKDGFSWCFSKPDATLTFTGKGPLYADNIISVNRNWQSLGNYINTLVISDGITSYGLNRKGDEASHGFYQNYDVVKVGKDFEDYFGLLDNACAATRYEVSADNPYFATYDGALYTKNYKTLLLVPTKQETVTLHSKTEALAGSDRVDRIPLNRQRKKNPIVEYL